ncbi:MAG: DNA primase [PVC group bacterium]|nr:DNA primase [PVC group bacterium]
MSRIPEQILEDIQQRLDIVEIVSSYIPLKRAGRNFKACCPFHHEKTGSFIVSPDKQIFHCFGCGVGGDVFSFLMKYERMEFPEAVKMLADKAGIDFVQEKTKDSSQVDSVSKVLYEVNELAALYFQHILVKDSQAGIARKYLSGRGLTPESIKRFRLGFAGAQWDGLVLFLRKKGISDALLVRSGVALKSSQGKVYDRFRNRVMFPIFNHRGKIIGFGGRILESTDTGGPKYVNSPETEIYKKSKTLYGFNFSKEFVSKQNYCVVVEGYLDFIIPFQAGMKNLVASSGTAFTIDHIRLIKRYTSNLVIVFDADDAGREAALRSLDPLIEEGMNVRIVNLEPGFDPDSWVRAKGAEGFSRSIDAAKNLFDFKLGLLLDRFKRDVPEEKAQIAHEMLSTIKKVSNAVIRASYIKKLSETINVPEEALLAELQKVKVSVAYERKRDDSYNQGVTNVSSAAEKMLLSLMFENEKFISQGKESISCDEFKDPTIKKITKYLYEAKEATAPVTILSKVNDPEVKSFISSLLVADLGINDQQKSFDDCVRKIKKDAVKMQITMIQKDINRAAQDDGDTEKLHGLYKRFHLLKKELKIYEEGN